MGSHASLRSTVIITVSAGFVIAAGGGLLLSRALSLGPVYPVVAVTLFAVVTGIVAMSVGRTHPFPVFGPANAVTTVRMALTTLVAAFVGQGGSPADAGTVVAISTVVTVCDGFDGWLARRTRMGSAFGARFDMETDAVLIMALSILAWQYGKAGVWIVASGLLRYAFVAAGWAWRWMTRPLPPRYRRKAVCVAQIVGLLLALLPVVTPPASSAVAAFSLLLLVWSFGADTWWLWRERRA